MEGLTIAAIALFLIAFGLISGRLQNSIITPPMVFVAFGMLVSPRLFGLFEAEIESEWVHLLVEFTLVFVLFADASRIDLKLLRREYGTPERLLGIGLPLTIVLGAVVAAWLFPGFSFWEAALLAAILAPTDAALGQVVVSHPKMPIRIRQALNVESGLNDGIALPVVLLFLALADVNSPTTSVEFWLTFTFQQIVLGTLIGIGVAYLGSKLIYKAWHNQWMVEPFQKLATFGLALLAWGGAELLGGNGFIAAFVAGLVVGNMTREICHSLLAFVETEGQLFVLLTFMVFGAVMFWPVFDHLTWQAVVYAILSLTVIRMLPVCISLLGKTRLMPGSFFMLSWFGPRGVASILFGLLALGAVGVPHHEEVFQVVMLTVLFSVFAHGMTAAPLAKWFSNYVNKKGEEGMEELKEGPDLPVRLPYHDK